MVLNGIIVVVKVVNAIVLSLGGRSSSDERGSSGLVSGDSGHCYVGDCVGGNSQYSSKRSLP